jgi:hypothetical protein
MYWVNIRLLGGRSTHFITRCLKITNDVLLPFDGSQSNDFLARTSPLSDVTDSLGLTYKHVSLKLGLTSKMQLPPGPSYLLRSFPHFAVPSTIAYACLTLAKTYLNLAVPTWLTVCAAILARPMIFFFNRYYSEFSDSRDAAANNAVLAPYVRESAFSIISKISESVANGYPGAL